MQSKYSLCINIITGNKYNPVSGDQIWFRCHRQYTVVYLFHRMLCFQFFIMHALHNSDAKIIPHLQKCFLFFYFTLVFPKYYIICLSGDDCLKMKEANIHNLCQWNFHHDWIWPSYKKKKKKIGERKTCSFSSTSAILVESWLILMEVQPPRSPQRKWRRAEMERMCAARVEGKKKDNGMMRL